MKVPRDRKIIITNIVLLAVLEAVSSFTKPPLLQESRLTDGGSPNLFFYVLFRSRDYYIEVDGCWMFTRFQGVDNVRVDWVT